eukprot:m.208091 g.208091  ORF g.208091 m.208091 type:complete len:283 (+) comp18527_c0_seq8:84-932(+)
MAAERPAGDVAVGTRVALVTGGSYQRGTVRYVGHVEAENPSKSGMYYGVEWDDASRGKHNGTFNNKEYFTCRAPTSGSFVKMTSKKLTFGSTVVDAIRERYADDRASDEIATPSNVVDSQGNRMTVKIIGKDGVAAKQRRLDQLRHVYLKDMVVSKVGPGNDIAHHCSRLETLELANNLISSWDVVAAIVAQVPSLRRLDLSDNRLCSWTTASPEAFQHLTALSLNNVDMSWSLVRSSFSPDTCLPRRENTACNTTHPRALAKGSQGRSFIVVAIRRVQTPW